MSLPAIGGGPVFALRKRPSRCGGPDIDRIIEEGTSPPAAILIATRCGTAAMVC